MRFCLRQLQEKCIELYRPFVDFSKAFDTIGRTGLRQLTRKYGCPENFTTMIEALYTEMMANVCGRREESESFSVTNGIKHGCSCWRHHLNDGSSIKNYTGSIRGLSLRWRQVLQACLNVTLGTMS
ncbi:hypothetical protein NP493_1444g02022 [Ridgeia piscesae]|uniref:Reverse transcriptase domain-containing protein n=1 Tax=Ridgeia piscesae TaxID=27915 RepID=A0AAD9K316_RIDPI|nr:hypothetical protein NP493_1444g02022 [Ridgeia piscesae]